MGIFTVVNTQGLPLKFSEMSKLPTSCNWAFAYGYSHRYLNLRIPSCVLNQWKIYRGPVCRAGNFGGEYRGKGAYNRKRTIKNSNGIAGQQEHYTVLGLAKNATSADIKRAFRTLARQYHPDVNKDPDADDSFKSIRLAYEVLSNESSRYQYDKDLRLQELGTNGHWRNWTESELKWGRRYSWAEPKRWARARGVTWEDYFEASEPSFYSHKDKEFVEEKTKERVPVEYLLRYVWFTIFCSQILGSQIALNLFSFCAILNRQMTAGYKAAHMVAWLIGGQRGILLILGISFTSWFGGKQYDNLVALVALALWVEIAVARFVPIPRGAIMAMTYFCHKLQLELS